MLQSPVDIAIVAGAILLLFGPKKVPELGKALGQGIGNFKRALFEAQSEAAAAGKDDASTAKTPADLGRDEKQNNQAAPAGSIAAEKPEKAGS